MKARGTLAALLIAFAVLPTVAAGLATYQTGRQLLEDDAHDLLDARAAEVAASLDALNGRYLAVARTVSHMAGVRSALAGEASADEARRLLESIRAGDAGIAIISVFSADGVLRLSTFRAMEGRRLGHVEKFLAPGLAFVTDPSSTGLVGGTNLIVSYGAPLHVGGQVAGAVVISLNGIQLEEIVDRAAGSVGSGSHAMLLDRFGLRIAFSGHPELMLRPAGPVRAEDVEAMAAWNRLGPRTRELLADVLPAPEEYRRAVAPGTINGSWRTKPATTGEWSVAVGHRLRSAPWTVFVRAPETTIYARIPALLRGTAIAAIAALLAAIGVAGLTSGVLTRRLREMALAAAALARGDAARVPDGGKMDELSLLARAFNDMAHAVAFSRSTLEHRVEERTRTLANANEEMAAQRTELLAQSDELQAQKRELEEKNIEVRRGDLLKSAFLANMSHELRTPLNAIIGFSELVLDNAAIVGKQREQLGYVVDSGLHLLRLINEILDLSKIESGQVELDLAPLDARAAVEDAWTSVAPAAAKRNVALALTVTTRSPLTADANRVRQILLNLFSNALKFAPDGSQVRVWVEERGGFARFVVEDEGPGVSPALAARIFSPFVQGDDALTKKHGGTGLGLTISKRLVELHGGTIEVGRAEGGGGHFSFTIPQASSQLPAVLASLAGVVEKPIDGRRALAEVTRTIARPGRVLSIDDDPKVGELLRGLLEPAGYVVTVALTGQAGIDSARSAPPDLVLVDLVMPDLSGFEVIEALGNDDRTRSIPTMVLSASDLSNSERDWLRTRVESTSLKGAVTLDDLLALIEQARHSATVPSGPAAGPAGDHVLIVDDNFANRELVRSLLERQGIKTRCVESGAEALAACQESVPRLVLLDIAMPGMDGFEVLKRLRANERTRQIPVVALTAMAMRGDEDRARREGFDGYLTKPIERARLAAELARWLPQQQQPV